MSLLALTAYLSDSDGDADGAQAAGSPALEDQPILARATPAGRTASGQHPPVDFARLLDVDAPVSPALQAKVEALHRKVTQGYSVNRHIREAKTFRNPDLLEKLVQIFGVDQRGTNFSPSVWQPHNLPAELNYKALEEARRQVAQRQHEERMASGRVTFVPAHAEPAAAAAPVAERAHKPKRSKWDVSGGVPSAGAAGVAVKREHGTPDADADKRQRCD
ncbi:hypothetical protein KFE25_006310 [Diacronema lutheri]|uniref:HCNGP-like protein n=1 Tax=Diacronema lutheri TaxID=2081491 RepID=A0A7R9UHG5_DIALT|nr:hypothetical protein KFE25_006310 [Diacronema lutheri]